MLDDFVNVRYSIVFLLIFVKFFLKLEKFRCVYVVKGGCIFLVYMYFGICYIGFR